MSYEFKRLSDVEVVEQPLSTANMLIEEEGVIKKAPIGKNNNHDFIIITLAGGEDLSLATCNKSYDEVLEMLASGNISYIYMKYVTPSSMGWGPSAQGIRAFGSGSQDVPAASDSVLGIEFYFNEAGAIYYYRDGFSLENRSE